MVALRGFPVISRPLLRPPNPEPYQGSLDAAASGFQGSKKERPIHGNHLLAVNLMILCLNNKRAFSRNQQISAPGDVLNRRARP